MTSTSPNLRIEIKVPKRHSPSSSVTYRFPGWIDRDYRRSLFKATFAEKLALVKFCETYSKYAHQLLAAKDFAPELYYFAELKGGLKMVVMEFCGEKNAYDKFYQCRIAPGLLRSVKEALEVLHDANFVFGDLRRPNILVAGSDEGSYRAKLVDFEWAGQAGKDSYPVKLNTSERWADGVLPLAIMEKKHDLDMFNMLNIL
jgi:serine/threonine protein kinase